MSNLLELVIRNSPTAIALLRGPDFVIEMMNPACQALSPGEEMAGRTLADVWPEAAPFLLQFLQVVRESGVAYHGDGQSVPLRRGPELPVEERYFDFSFVPLAQDGVGFLECRVELLCGDVVHLLLRCVGYLIEAAIACCGG